MMPKIQNTQKENEWDGGRRETKKKKKKIEGTTDDDNIIKSPATQNGNQIWDLLWKIVKERTNPKNNNYIS